MKNMFLIFIITVFLYSCSNNTIEGPNKSKENNNGKGTSIQYSYTPNNSLNPYDSIGYWHNEALNIVISNKNLFTCDSADFIDELKTILSDWFDDNQAYLPNYYTDNYVDSLVGLTLTTFSDFLPDSIIENYALNDTAETEVKALFDLIIGYQDSSSLNPLINSIKSWESTVIASNYSVELKKQLLETSAIVRWSAAYWWDVANDESNPWWTVINCNQGLLKNHQGKITGFWDVFAKVLGIGAVDGLGFISGGIVGAVTGSVFAGVHLFTDGGILGAIDDVIDWIGGLFG